MKDKDLQELLREAWSPKPPAELKRKALSATQTFRQDRSPLRRFALRAGVALAASAAAACIALVLIHPGAPGRGTRTTSAPPARITNRVASPIPKTLAGAAKQATAAQPRIRVAAKKLPTSKTRRQVASRPDTDARVSYVDADKFDAAQAEVPGYTTAAPNPEPDGAVRPDARVAYRRPGGADKFSLADRTPARTRALSPEMEDVR
jgi:hypothetical protein